MDPAVAVAVSAPLVRAEASPPFHASSAKGERAGIERRRPLSYSDAAGAAQLTLLILIAGRALSPRAAAGRSTNARTPRAAAPLAGRPAAALLSFPATRVAV